MQTRNIVEIIKHPEYNFRRYHDIGLLKLDKQIKLDIYVRPACLYTERNLPGNKAIATGWENAVFAAESTRDMVKVLLEHVDVVKCNDTYRRVYQADSILKDGILDEYMLCYDSSTDLKDTCQVSEKFYGVLKFSIK